MRYKSRGDHGGSGCCSRGIARSEHVYAMEGRKEGRNIKEKRARQFHVLDTEHDGKVGRREALGFAIVCDGLKPSDGCGGRTRWIWTCVLSQSDRNLYPLRCSRGIDSSAWRVAQGGAHAPKHLHSEPGMCYERLAETPSAQCLESLSLVRRCVCHVSFVSSSRSMLRAGDTSLHH